MTSPPSRSTLAPTAATAFPSRLWTLSSDLLAVTDLTGRFLTSNTRWQTVTGLDARELSRVSLFDLMHPIDRGTALRCLEELPAARSPIEFEGRFQGTDDSYVHLRCQIEEDSDLGHWFIAATDLTEHRASKLRLEILQAMATAANEASDFERALAAAAKRLSELLGWQVKGIHVLPPADDGDEAVLDPGKHLALVSRAASSGQFQWTMSVDDTGAAVLPIHSDGQVVAVLEFATADAASPDPALVDALTYAGNSLGRVHLRSEAGRAEQHAVEVERRFLSMLTHELQSPLMAIKGFVGLLLDRNDRIDDDKHDEFLTHIDTSANRMHRLVQEFLRLARHHQDGFQPRTERLELADLVQGAVEELAVGMHAVTLDIHEPLQVLADAQFTTQILTNLLTNAERYGAPPVVVTARRQGDYAIMSVRDHGPGVPESFRPHMFKRFARAERTGDGTGLGLSISRELAVAQGGTLYFEPADPGARFVVTIPAA